MPVVQNLLQRDKAAFLNRLWKTGIDEKMSLEHSWDTLLAAVLAFRCERWLNEGN